ncbi:unnamed protein product [Didymodactylos carnosus]|uniref:Uncharacterized protein n=1 Tax=Didymodactylos carnosus TaxID=1234261 RepID=A0A815QRF0_9BILA|nr:unnamed protein product [Didymodactylos carnosus]CAF1465974.1 unnamed protein product [Didymodactylos carnosus]CAF4183729.1 unnamed protein product [Didymodactylos carnosus]CAF4335113.1 unnamed protein product [Didymodactylos carnosus]
MAKLLRTSSSNDYHNLKWPLIIFSIATTVLVGLIFAGYLSNEWFTYELVNTDNQTYERTLEYGSLGLWHLCTGHVYMPMNCDTWTKATRPTYFNIVLVLFACALLVTNLTLFPAYAAAILIAYNSHNYYVRYIGLFIYILIVLAFTFTVLLVTATIFASVTQFYSPGRFVVETKYLFFHRSTGIYLAEAATILSITLLILIIITIIWRKYIEMQRLEAEKALLRQIFDENYRPGWYKIKSGSGFTAPIATSETPPPYESLKKQNISNINN